MITRTYSHVAMLQMSSVANVLKTHVRAVSPHADHLDGQCELGREVISLRKHALCGDVHCPHTSWFLETCLISEHVNDLCFCGLHLRLAVRFHSPLQLPPSTPHLF